MRRTRRLLLVLITAIVSGVAVIYTVQRDTQARNAPAPPAVLPASVSSRADNWSWQHTESSRTIVRVFARDVRQLVEEQRMELEHVTLHLFHKDGKVFDEVKSAKADFDMKSDHLYSEGEVEITMGIPAGVPDANRARLVHIKTSGVRFDKKTGNASTDRPAEFKFDRGEGRSIGARYDPTTRELHMQNDVSLTWFGETPTDKRMDIQAGSLVYHEAESKIWLTPWSKFKRDALAVESGNSVVTLVDGHIQHVEALQARGVDTQPKRTIQFAADELRMNFNAKGAVEAITGDKNAKLVSIAPGSQTTVDTKRVDLEFEAPDSESMLKKALATGGAVVESKPLATGAAPLPETRVVRSDVIALYMRNSGEEIDRVETESPGTVDFIPNRPGQKKRFLSGERLTMHYGPANQIKSFRAVTVSTRTDAEQVHGKPAPPPALTWSKDLLAEFDEKTGALQQMEQWDDFRYEEGERRARAQKATLTAPKDEITLAGGARVWDPAGSTSGDVITMNQKSGDFTANGNVSSTRLPDKKKPQQPGMLSGDDPIHAKAATMESTGRNGKIRYEGNALMWQGANRLQAHQITIDRAQGLLTAEGDVVSQLIDNSEQKPGAKKKSPVFTIVRAPRMTYSDKDRVAHYTGGSLLDRGATTVNAREIRAFLKQGETDSSLDRAVADGSVKIVQSGLERTRTGVSEHAEYYAADGRVVLNGGAPELADTMKGVTRGKQLTWFANNDRLLVEGAQGQPVDTKLLRKNANP